MKKVRLSLAALVLIVAIAGTATANAKTKADPCYKVDPKLQVCTNGSEEPCCEDDLGNIYYYPAF
jgi:hypothetical protein